MIDAIKFDKKIEDAGERCSVGDKIEVYRITPEKGIEKYYEGE